MAKKGGMSANAFIGRERLDQIDLMQYRTADASPEQIILLETIKDAAHNYLNFGFGRNGSSAEEFFGAYRYLFVITSDAPSFAKNDKYIVNKYK